jgi:hypothetical protein
LAVNPPPAGHRSDRGLRAKVALGRIHAGQTVSIAVSDTTLAIELDDVETRVVCRTTTKPVRNIKANQPWKVPSIS